MNARQEAKLSMYRAVLNQSEEKTSLIESVPAFANAMAALKTTIAAVLSTVQQQVQVTSGATVTKTAAKQALCSFANDVAAAMFAYSAATNNLVLKEKSKTSLTDLLRTKDDELAPRCRNYYDLAKNNADALKDYGITDSLISSFKTAIDNYATVVPTPRNAVAQRAAYRKNLAELIRQADKILKERLDKLVNSFKAADANFIDAYRSNRIILDPGKTVTQLKITVTSAGGALVPNAEMEIVEQSLTFKSNSKGGILLSPVTPGTYTLKVTAPNFEAQTLQEVKVTMGQVNRLTVTLKLKV